jgi:hypothetical protein
MLEPILFAHIKPSLLRNCLRSIKVSSILKFLPEASIFLELGKKG